MRIALFYTASCYSAHAFQGYQDGTLKLFWEMASCSLALCAVLARVLTQSLWRNNWRECQIFMWTAIHCILCEISSLRTHLQWAHLLIRPDPGDWLALLFRVWAIEICLSFKYTNTRSYLHTHLHTHTLYALLDKLTSSLCHFFGWLEGCCVMLMWDRLNIILPLLSSCLTFLCSSLGTVGLEEREAQE